MPRFALSSIMGADGVFSGDEAHHIAKVHRMKEGDQLEAVFGGVVYVAKINHIQFNRVEVSLIGERPSPEPSVKVSLYQGLLKADKVELVVQKGVELGVWSIHPVECARSIVKVESGNMDTKLRRWQKIASEAAKQSGRALVPEVQEPISLNMALREAVADLKLIAHESSEHGIASVLKEGSWQSVAVLVGPEGGFTAEEVQNAQEAGFIAVGLGPRILRAETAPLVMLSIIMYEIGDLGGRTCQR
ncbi:MAG: 16S rRNA (uracil(1498)-N(3))-methyltransferase [bacterium]|nr:16S rRNA (uracil(1498)-N(3))-methyltransferase [bacterium]